MRDCTAALPLSEQGQVVPATTEEWTREVVPRLPEHLEQQAKVLKAFERRRQVGSATDLLRGLLAYVYAAHSFQHLSIWSVLLGVADVSANDWRKRLQRASAWLSWLLQEMLASRTQAVPWLLRGGWRRVLLIDGTHFKCPGPQGIVWRVHTAFDLVAGRLTQLRVTDQHVAEQLEMFDLRAGDLVITDCANGLRQRVAFVHKHQADLLVRFSPRNFPLQEEDGTPLDVVRWLKGCAAPAGRVVGRRVWMSFQGERTALRWVAVRLSPEQQAASQRRKKRRASKKQHRLQAETLYLAGWVLLITTLPSELWSDQQIARLYRARWHIELVFKRIKQLLKQQHVRCTTAATAVPAIIVLLLGWALVEEESTTVRQAIREAMQCQEQAQEDCSCPQEHTKDEGWPDERDGPLSEWMLAEISVDLVCQQIRGQYTAARYHACLPRLPRFRGSGHRQRPHRYSQVCRWLDTPMISLEEQVRSA
jgi:hypothetical protein